jgi:hypothetical protein
MQTPTNQREIVDCSCRHRVSVCTMRRGVEDDDQPNGEPGGGIKRCLFARISGLCKVGVEEYGEAR